MDSSISTRKDGTVLYQGTCPDGSTVSRRSGRAYSHVVVGRDLKPSGVAGATWSQWYVVGWCGRLDLAEKTAAKAYRDHAQHVAYRQRVGEPFNLDTEVEIVEAVIVPTGRGRKAQPVAQVEPVDVSTMTNDEIDAYEVAAMNQVVAEMARDAVAQVQQPGDLVRSLVACLASESAEDVAAALGKATKADHLQMFGEDVAEALGSVAATIGGVLQQLAEMAVRLVNGRYVVTVDQVDETAEHVADMVGGLDYRLHVLAVEIEEDTARRRARLDAMIAAERGAQ